MAILSHFVVMEVYLILCIYCFCKPKVNVNILLEIKRTVGDFLKHLKESMCKLELDVIPTDFFIISLHQHGLDYRGTAA